MNTDMIDSDQQSKSDPIFVVGMNGSGTTLMLDCLDNHSNLYGFRRETLIIPYFIKKSKRLGNLSNHSSFQQLWQEFTSTSCFYYLNDGNVIPLPPNWQQLPHTVATIIDQTFLYFAHKAGKKRWCEKTPRHAIHIEMLAHHFPNAKFIHMIRDGRACAASFHRRWQYNPQQTIYRWKNLVHEAKRQGAQVKDRYLEIPFEGLTSNPEPWMRRVCDFINEPFEPEILGPSRIRTFTGSESARIEKNKTYGAIILAPSNWKDWK